MLDSGSGRGHTHDLPPLHALSWQPSPNLTTRLPLLRHPPAKLFMHVLHCPQRCFRLMAPAAAEARVRRMRSDSRQLRLCFTYRLARASWRQGVVSGAGLWWALVH